MRALTAWYSCVMLLVVEYGIINHMISKLTQKINLAPRFIEKWRWAISEINML